MLTIKKSTALLFVLALTCITSLLVVSCNNNPPGSVLIEIPKDNSGLDTINHFIPENQIKEYKAAFKTQRDSLTIIYPSLLVPESEAFNKRALLSLLKAPDCVGIRIYHGVKTGRKNEIRLVLVGVDSKGQDILIDKGSVLAAKITDEVGGEENGQCPNCAASGPGNN